MILYNILSGESGDTADSIDKVATQPSPIVEKVDTSEVVSEDVELINEEDEEDKSEKESSEEEVKKEVNEIPSDNAVVTSTTARTGREYSREEFKSALRRLLEETPGKLHFAILNKQTYFLHTKRIFHDF